MASPKMLGIIPLGGGMNIGFERAGFKSLDHSLEVSEGWAANLKLNRPEITTHLTELEDWEAYVESLREEPPQLVFGSPPCQGVTGASKTSGADNPKNQWMLHFARAATTANPNFILFENIPRMMSIGRAIVNEVEAIGRKAGYTMTAHEHHVQEFGVCQRRKRVMFVMEKKGEEITWPSHDPVRAPTVMETIGDLQSVEPTQSSDDQVSYAADVEPSEYEAALRNPAGFTWDHDSKPLPERFNSIPPGRSWWDGMPEELMTDKEKDRIAGNRLYNAMELHRLHPDRVARTLTGARNKQHPFLNRLLTVRESSRLMAFPDDWKWALRGDCQQFAAGVCPPVTQWYGEVMMHVLAGNEIPTMEGRLF